MLEDFMKKVLSLCIIVLMIIPILSNMMVANAAYTYTDASGFQFIVVNRKAYINGYVGTSTNLQIPTTVYNGQYSVYYVTEYAFDNTNIESATFRFETVETATFMNCKQLKLVNLASKVIGGSAFAGCVKLETIYLTNRTTTIGSNAFQGCSSLKNVYYDGTLAEKNAIVIASGNTYLEKATWHFTICENNGHSYDGICDSECNVCGNVRTAHKYDNACDTQCNLCGNTRTTSHKYDNDCDSNCNICGSTRSVSHIYDNACDSLCNRCNYERTVGNHSYSNWTQTKAPTCTEKGSRVRKCTICNYSVTEQIAELGHNYSTEWTIDTEATCTTDGSKSKHCSRCSSKANITTIKATGHSYGEWKIKKEATCTADGKQSRLCSVCSFTEEKVISAKGHSYSNEWTVDIDPTCTSTGSKSHHCLICDAKTGLTTISSIGHNFDEWKDIKQPTYKETGEAQRKCKNKGCSKTETKTIAKLALDGHTHNFKNWETKDKATCVKNGENIRRCTICTEFETSVVLAKGHDFDNWQIEKKQTCTEDGCTVRTCKICDEKEYNIIPLDGHKFSEGVVTEILSNTQTGIMTSVCTVCGETKKESILNYQDSAIVSQDINAVTNDGNNKINYNILFIVISVGTITMAGTIAAIILFERKKLKHKENRAA